MKINQDEEESSRWLTDDELLRLVGGDCRVSVQLSSTVSFRLRLPGSGEISTTLTTPSLFARLIMSQAFLDAGRRPQNDLYYPDEEISEDRYAYMRGDTPAVILHGSDALRLPEGYADVDNAASATAGGDGNNVNGNINISVGVARRREYTEKLLMSEFDQLPQEVAEYSNTIRRRLIRIIRKEEHDQQVYQSLIERLFLRSALLKAIYTGGVRLRSHIQLDTKVQGRFEGYTVLMLLMTVKFRDRSFANEQTDTIFREWIFQAIREQQYDTTVRDDTGVSVFSHLRDAFRPWSCGDEGIFSQSLLSSLMSSTRFHPIELLASSPPDANGVHGKDLPLVRWIAEDMVSVARVNLMSTEQLQWSEVYNLRFDFFMTLINELKYQYTNHPDCAVWTESKSLDKFLGDLYSMIICTLYDAFDPQLLLDCLLLLPTSSFMYVNIADLVDETYGRSKVHNHFNHISRLRYSSTSMRISAYIILAIERWQRHQKERKVDENDQKEDSEEKKVHDTNTIIPTTESNSSSDQSSSEVADMRVAIDSEVAPNGPLWMIDYYEEYDYNLPSLDYEESMIAFLKELRTKLSALMLRTKCARALCSNDSWDKVKCNIGMTLLIELLTVAKEQRSSERVSFMWESVSSPVSTYGTELTPQFFTIQHAVCRLSTVRLQTLLPHIDQLLEACDRTEDQSDYLRYEESDLLQICDAWELDDFILGPQQSVRWMLLDRIMSQYYYDIDNSIPLYRQYDETEPSVNKSASIPPEARRLLFKRITDNLIQHYVAASSRSHEGDNDDGDENSNAGLFLKHARPVRETKNAIQTLIHVCQTYPQWYPNEHEIDGQIIYECVRYNHPILMQWMIDEGRLTTSDWLIRDHSSNENIVERVRANFETYDINKNISYRLLENEFSRYVTEVLTQRHTLVCEVMIPPLADIVAEYLSHPPLPSLTWIQLSASTLPISSASYSLMPSLTPLVDAAILHSNHLNSFHDIDWKSQKYEFWLGIYFDSHGIRRFHPSEAIEEKEKKVDEEIDDDDAVAVSHEDKVQSQGTDMEEEKKMDSRDVDESAAADSRDINIESDREEEKKEEA